MKLWAQKITFLNCLAVLVLMRLFMGVVGLVDAILIVALLGYKIWQAYWEWKLANFPKPLRSNSELESDIANLKSALTELQTKVSNVSLAAGFNRPPRGPSASV